MADDRRAGARPGVGPASDEAVSEGEEIHSDGGLTVTLDGDDVTTVRGGERYPGPILSRDADGIEGEFTASSTSFPFSATLADGPVTLAGGGAPHTLPRPAPANPLGGD